jgi:hypothetical protein
MTNNGFPSLKFTARNLFRQGMRGLATIPPLVMLHSLWWKNRPLLWRKISHRGNKLVDRPVGPGRRRILLYCPETLVREHFMALQAVARPLAEMGHQILMSHCAGIFDRCMPKDSVRGDTFSAEGARVCSSCIRSRFDLLKQPDFDGFSLGKAITPDVRREARGMIKALPDAALADFTIDGFRLGLACWHDLILSRKLMFDTPLTAEHYLYVRQYLQSVVAAYLGMKTFLPRAGFTDVLIYGQYAANIALICAARKTGINWRLVSNINHLGVDRRRFHIHQAQSHLWATRMITDWPSWSEIPLPPDEIEETGEDVLIRFGAKSFTTYSPAKTRDSDVLSTLGLDPTRKLVVAFTSSLDEYHAEEIIDEVLGLPVSPEPQRPYPDQISWLKSISNEIGRRRDLQLVIRIHPREDANKREGARSRHLELLRQHLADLPDNVKVVWPADPISSYDLLEVANLIQVWSSTVGLESARLGIPVIKMYRGYASYAEGEFVLSASTHQEILAIMDEALVRRPDLGRLIKAWRFYAYSRFGTSIDLRDALPDIRFSELPPYRRPRHLPLLQAAVFGNEPPTTINRHRHGLMETRLPVAMEEVVVKRQLRRIIHALLTGEDPPADVEFEIQAENVTTKDMRSGALAIEGSRATYAWKGQLYIRYSPMCARLGALTSERPPAARSQVN